MPEEKANFCKLRKMKLDSQAKQKEKARLSEKMIKNIEKLISKNKKSVSLSTPTEVVSSSDSDLIISNKINIPKHRMRLLWIDWSNPDRKGAGFKFLLDESETKNDWATFQISHFSAAEPSTIYTNLPIKKPKDINDVEDLGYYPSYENLSPEQRWIYLNWLQDISTSIPIGYVFIYYYGLERHLVFGHYEKALEEIIQLNKYHPSILKYSYNAILYTCLLKNDYIKLKRVLETIIEKPIDNIRLLLQFKYGHNLNINEIFEVIAQLKDINKSYLKSYPELYLNELQNILMDSFGNDEISLNNILNINELTLVTKLIYSNYSFPSEVRSLKVPDIFCTSKFINKMKSIHSKVHNSVKEKMKLLRKKS